MIRIVLEQRFCSFMELLPCHERLVRLSTWSLGWLRPLSLSPLRPSNMSHPSWRPQALTHIMRYQLSVSWPVNDSRPGFASASTLWCIGADIQSLSESIWQVTRTEAAESTLGLCATILWTADMSTMSTHVSRHVRRYTKSPSCALRGGFRILIWSEHHLHYQRQTS